MAHPPFMMRLGDGRSGYRSSVALLLASLLAGSGCATLPVTSFERARTLGAGHAEFGGGIMLARHPAEGAIIAQRDQGSEGEPWLAPPTPALHFRLGILENLDAGLETWPGGLRLSGRYGILDEDELMLALKASLGWWSSGASPADGERLSALGPLLLGFQVPLATRPASWLELNLTPTFELLQILGERTVYLEEQSRSYFTFHTGFSVGANFAIWRIRLHPEVAVLASYRSDRGEGFFGAYPGIGAFIVY